MSKLYRYGRAYEDSSLNLGGIAGPLSDTLQAVRPAKWTTLFFSVNGTMGSGSLQAIAWCGSRYSPDDNILVGCDTLAIGSTGRYAWDWNVYTSDIVLPVFSVGVTVGGAVTVDSIMVVKNW